MPTPPHLEVVAAPLVNHAMGHNGIRFLHRVVLAAGDAQLTDLTVSAALLDSHGQPLTRPWSHHVAQVEPLASVVLDHPALDLDPAAISAVLEPGTGTLRVWADAGITADSPAGDRGPGMPLIETSCPIRVLAARQWLLDPQAPVLSLELLTAFVQPNDPAVAGLLGAVATQLERATGSGSLAVGHVTPDRIDAIVAAVCTALHDRGIFYAEPPASWGYGQLVRSTGDVLAHGVGTCLDTTITVASVLEHLGVTPVLWVATGHAFVGYWRRPDTGLPDAASLQPALGINAVDLGVLGVVETTMLTRERRPPRDLWRRASQAPKDAYFHGGQADLVGVVDVGMARLLHVYPVPARHTRVDGVVELVDYRPATGEPSPPIDGPGPAPGAAVAAVAAAGGSPEGTAPPAEPEPPRVQAWKNSLLDLTLRNKLLNAGHGVTRLPLLLPGEHLGLLGDLLQHGQSIALRAVDDLGGAVAGQAARDAYGLPADIQRRMLRERTTVYTGVDTETHKALVARLRYRARTGLQETGANPLAVTLGTVRWRLGERDLVAPLLLAPVELKGLIQPYKVVFDDAGALTLNLSLMEKLRLEFGVTVPGLDPLPQHPDGTVEVAEVVRLVREAFVAAGLAFTVETDAAVAIVGFTGYLLWRDLDEHWPRFLDRPLAGHLARTPTEQFVDPLAAEVDPSVSALDAVVAAAPIPADASQAEAIAAARAGRTFVLEGPPGTGKSQTITNILADQLAHGRRVLFVAEKGAALDVVRRRLADVGLLPFALDLHDEHARPALVRERLRAALALAPRADEEGHRAAAAETMATSASLASYAQRLHAPNGAGLSLYAAHSRRLAAGDGPVLSVPHAAVSADGPGALDVEAARRGVGQAVGLLGGLGEHAAAAWGFATSIPADPTSVGVAVRGADAAYRVARQRLDACPPAVQQVLDGAGDERELTSAAWLLTEGSTPSAVLRETATTRWAQARAELEGRLARLHEQAAPVLADFAPTVFEVPFEPVRQTVREAAASFFLGRKGRLVAAAAPVLAHARPGASIAPKALPVLVEQLAAIAEEARRVGDGWRALPGLGALPSATTVLSEQTEAARRGLLQSIERDRGLLDTLTGAVRARLEAIPDGQRVPPEVYAGLQAFAGAFGSLGGTTGAGEADVRRWAADHGGLLPAWAAGGSTRVADLSATATLRRWVEAVAALEPMAAAGLDEARWQLLSGRCDPSSALAALDRGVAQTCCAERLSASGLAAFDAGAHQRVVDRFVDASQRLRDSLDQVLPERLVSARPFRPGTWFGKVAALEREVSRARGGLSVRRLVQDYGDVIGAITPCVLVSPDSLARFVPPGAIDFDLVVFDEASQITVPDAIGALGRARAAVIAGDSKQMPPTAFGELSTGAADDEQAADYLVVRDEESILSELVHAGVERRWLSWHYRSRDEQLIAFSNAQYYEDRLCSFPACPGQLHDTGISVHRVDGTFHRSGEGGLLRTNPVEAQAVVAEILRRWAAGERSIGVVTFNLQQRTLIEKMLWESGVESIVESLARSTDGLFVKNLENVQGDERDVVLFSTGFAKNPQGVLPLNFGPLNRAGGERRLNVAITRARRRVMVFTSFDPQDLRVEQTSSVGIAHLRAYLERSLGIAAPAADQGQLVESVAALRAPTRQRHHQVERHRDDIAEALRAAGLTVQTGVGLSDFKVDLAVGLPGQRPCAAVLLDNLAWSQRRTTADRDGLPAMVLHDVMGWPAVLRVWLPAWLSQREATVAWIQERVREASTATRRVGEQVVATGYGVGPTDGGRVSPGPADAPAPEAVPSGEPPVDPPTSAAPLMAAPTDAASTADPPLADAPAPRAASPSRSVGVDLTAQPVPSDGASDSIPTPTTDPQAPGSALGAAGSALGAAAYRPYAVHRSGSTGRLDALHVPRNAVAVQELFTEIVGAEGPVSVNRAALLVVRCHGLTRLTTQRLVDLRRIVPTQLRRDPEEGFLWPADRDPLRWEGFRTWTGSLKDRPLDEIAVRELANAAAAVTRSAMGIGVADLLRETLRLFGGTRLTDGARDRLEVAVRLAEHRGQLRVLGGVATAGSRP